MTVTDTLTYLDIALTVGKMALFVGCPTAGVTWVVGSFVIRRAASMAIKTAARKAAGTALAAGAAATIAASLLSATGGGERGTGSGVAVGVSQDVLNQTSSQIVLELDGAGSPRLVLDGDAMTPQDAAIRLVIQARHGSLRRIQAVNRLPRGQHGEWVLKVQQIAGIIPHVPLEWIDG